MFSRFALRQCTNIVVFLRLCAASISRHFPLAPCNTDYFSGHFAQADDSEASTPFGFGADEASSAFFEDQKESKSEKREQEKLAPAKNKQDSKNVDSKKKDKKKKKAGKISSDSFPSVNRSAQVGPEEVSLMSPAVLLSLLVCVCFLCATESPRMCVLPACY